MTFAAVTDSLRVGPRSLLHLPDSARSGSVPLLRTSSPALWDSLSGSDLESRSVELAGAFREYGLERGRRVAILAEAGPDATVVILAAVRAGGTALVIDPAVTREKLTSILVERGVVQAVAGDEVQLRRLLEIRADLPDLELVLVAHPDPSDRPTPALRLDAACVAGAEALQRDREVLGSVVANPVIETAGPGKVAASWSEAELLRDAGRLAAGLNLNSSDTVLVKFRADHLDLTPLLVACLSIGATVAFVDPKENFTLASIGRSRATIAAIGPFDLDALCRTITESGNSKSWVGRKLQAWAVQRGRNRLTHPRAHQIAERLVLRRLRDPAGPQLRLIQVFGPLPQAESIALLNAVGFSVASAKIDKS